MLLIDAKNIKKEIGDRLLFKIDSLTIYEGDRIGMVGLNGSGKTTLMNILAGEDQNHEGDIKILGKIGYIRQFDTSIDQDQLSGGEKTRIKIDHALKQQPAVLLADEPTSNLDFKGIEMLEKRLGEFTGALVVISHDRGFLDQLCNKIIEIEGGGIKGYSGNYSQYLLQKEADLARSQREYEDYIKEKKRLYDVKQQISQKSKTMRKTPKRMGNSEARLHKRGVNAKKTKIEKTAKAIESRIQQLEVKEKPLAPQRSKMDLLEEQMLKSKYIIRMEDISFSYPDKILLKNINLLVKNGDKVALMGNNGCGKTTLINLITQGYEGIYIAPSAKIGYFHQNLKNLNENASILENVMEESVYPETYVRILLARLLLKGDQVYKTVNVLSGGERVKVQLAKLFCSEFNFLILDEPGSYLDIYSLEALEEVMLDYGGTLLFVSHDRRLIDRVATKLLLIEKGIGTYFEGNYTQYLERLRKKCPEDQQQKKMELMRLETQLSELIGKISMGPKPNELQALDFEYQKVLNQIKALRAVLK